MLDEFKSVQERFDRQDEHFEKYDQRFDKIDRDLRSIHNEVKTFTFERKSTTSPAVGRKSTTTPGVRDLPLATNVAVLQAVRSFNDFTTDNDPRGEHDLGSVDVMGETFFFKVDYYSPD